MQRIGLQPGNGDSWFQDVPMTETTADESTVLKITQGGKTELKFGTDMVVGTRTGQAEVKVDASDLVFVGYGVDAPEQKWNDYAGQDWKGKTVVMFVNDPGFHVDDAKLFDGKRMTYLRPLDLQVRGGRPQARRRADRARHRGRLRLGRGEEFLGWPAVRPARQG